MELKETLELSLKGMWNILVSPVLLFRIKKRKKIWSILWEERLQDKLHKTDHPSHTNLQIVLLND